MSIQLYNYGEGLMGKVASDKCHKWVFKELNDSEPNNSKYWQSSFDALFSSTRNTSSVPLKQSIGPSDPPAPIFNWSQRPLQSSTSVIGSQNFQNSRLGLSQGKDEALRPIFIFIPIQMIHRCET
ncbi:Rice salt sensitive [Thalictrum thalictroides]|uniref:Salt sensitive n=1 Tax=Thalictrum thalictroides TaxID=46969 RepID=A0A7J6XEE9_THATH|nr:Rice salt sensitive [Thalictrum thalictroides]